MFKKKRHGTLQEVIRGRKYKWIIPNIIDVRQGVLDSPKSKSFEGTSFHFHMMCSTTSTVGFYIHYKTCPVPKYTYNLESCTGEPMRQHTAHSIPPNTTRCGHWNVCSLLDIEALQRRSSSEVVVVCFAFDEDTVATSHAASTWMVPRFPSLPLLPLCSGAFPVLSTPGVAYHFRIDKSRENPEEAAIIVTTKRGTPPRHEIVVTTGKTGKEVVLLQYKSYEHAHDFTGHPRFRIADAKEACGAGGFLQVQVTFEDDSNPIAFFNKERRAPGPYMAPERIANIQEGGDNKTYALMEDD